MQLLHAIGCPKPLKWHDVALEHITKYARSHKLEAEQTIRDILQMSNFERKTFEDAATNLKTHARIALHFHPDRLDPAMKTVAEALF